MTLFSRIENFFFGARRRREAQMERLVACITELLVHSGQTLSSAKVSIDWAVDTMRGVDRVLKASQETNAKAAAAFAALETASIRIADKEAAMENYLIERAKATRISSKLAEEKAKKEAEESVETENDKSF